MTNSIEENWLHIAPLLEALESSMKTTEELFGCFWHLPEAESKTLLEQLLLVGWVRPPGHEEGDSPIHYRITSLGQTKYDEMGAAHRRAMQQPESALPLGRFLLEALASGPLAYDELREACRQKAVAAGGQPSDWPSGIQMGTRLMILQEIDLVHELRTENQRLYAFLDFQGNYPLGTTPPGM